MAGSISIRDEILEVLYWLRGEGIRDAVRTEDLRPFLGIGSEAAREHLDALAAAGMLEVVPGGSPDDRAFRLTDRGSLEAGRRFVESFSSFLGQGHGTACAPGCDCRDPTRPDADCPTHGARARTHSS